MDNKSEFIKLDHQKIGQSLENKQLNLDQNWEFRQANTTQWYNAQIPGCNFTDLLNNNQITDPFYRAAEKDLQWIEKEDWEYKTSIELTEDDLQYEKINLIFEGLDTYANVYVNEQLVLEADNMFLAYECELKQILKPGLNAIRVYFYSPLAYVQQEAKAAGLTYPAGNDHAEEKLSVFTRKAPYHYGWDWGPRFVTSGIWKPVSLRFFNELKIDQVLLSSYFLDGHQAVVNGIIELDSNMQGEIDIIVDVDDIESVYRYTAWVQEGVNELPFAFSIGEVKRWWPRGLGDPHLYQFKFRLQANEKRLDQYETKFGFRTIELVQDKDELGQTFYFQVNGVPLFAKGANYIPQDSFLDRVDDEKYRQLFQNVIDSGMNMIRVWGGGIYEKKIFYDLADELGVLVWQDFMFACTMYPGDEAFLASVEKEAIYNVKRLKNHPSIALWCGNNEIAVGWGYWGWQEEYGYSEKQQEELYSFYVALFDGVLPKVIAKYDPDKFYLPSSPIYNYDNLDNYALGDVHYWGVWHEEEPFSTFKKYIPRFMSEYGFQSFPVLDSVKRYTKEEDWDIGSEVMKIHQKHPRGNKIIEEYLLRDYKQPKDFESFLYLSQVLQAEGIRMAIEAHKVAKPFCMGTLYWQLNDCWPVASWSSIDYYGKWKALHYFVKKAYQDLTLVMDEDADDLVFHASSDLISFERALLHICFTSFSGEVHGVFEEEIEIPANGKYTFRLSKDRLPVSRLPKSELIIAGKLIQDGRTVYENTYYLMPPKELNLQQPNIEQDIQIDGNTLKVKLTTDVLAKNVFLWSEDIKGNFSDNFFDLLPDRKKTITVKLENNEGTAVPTIKWMSVFDTYS